jgi:hypothetical protein
VSILVTDIDRRSFVVDVHCHKVTMFDRVVTVDSNKAVIYVGVVLDLQAELSNKTYGLAVILALIPSATYTGMDILTLLSDDSLTTSLRHL